MLALALLLPAGRALAEEPDAPVAGGRFYRQANGRGGAGNAGFAIVDDGGARLWSEFQRLGGVDRLGYPASHRFTWDGFLVQVTQRVVLQWRPEVGQAYFVNVFDRLHDLGRDDWLWRERQVPKMADWSIDTGKPWSVVAANHLALLEANAAIKARYYDAPGDPVQLFGLPMAPVADVGNAYVLRAQRVVIQQWKEDVPWARKGDVTVALGGDIAKELDLFPAAAVEPSELAAVTASAPTSPLATAAPPTAPPTPGAPASPPATATPQPQPQAQTVAAPASGRAPTRTGTASVPAVDARAVVVVDEASGAVLYARNAHDRLAPASITKIATAIVALERGRLPDMVTVTYDPAALDPDSSLMGVSPGDRVTLEDLLYGLMLPSGNEAAVAIASHIAGSEKRFVELMNAKVRELGLQNTNFANPHGLDAPDHYSSAYDMVMLARYGMQRYPAFQRLAAARKWTVNRTTAAGVAKPFDVYNLNRLLGRYAEADGVKIGYTDNAGRTLVGSATRKGQRVYVGLMNAGDLVRDSVPLFDWVFQNYTW